MKRQHYVLGLVLLVIIFLAGCAAQPISEPVRKGNHVAGDVPTVQDVEEKKKIPVSDNEIKATITGTKYIIDPSLIRDGGPPKGGIGVDRGIPALDKDNINFVSVAEAEAWIEDNELVLALIHNGVKKVYPLQILVWHEIANDVVGGDPLAITYCPLCGSAIAYDRRIMIDGVEKTARFGTSGKLYNSNLVMYDDLTDTYWQQIDGKAIVGELTGSELKEISVDTVSWREFKAVHSDALVLSQDTGMNRDYGRDPYGSYYEDSYLIFPVDNSDDSVHPKTVIFGIEVNGVYKAYKEADLVATPQISDTVGGVEISLERDGAGIITIKDADGKEIVKERDFWFAWYAFHPSTELYNR
jgi:hypothetical protein